MDANTVRRKVFIDIYVRCVVYFSLLDGLLNNNYYSSVLFLGKFIKVHTSLEGLGFFFFLLNCCMESTVQYIIC